jgi:hypothetical protein
LLCGARSVRGRARFPTALPREAGHGCVCVTQSLPDRLQLFGEGDPGLTTGATREFPLAVTQAATLRAVLTWYDAPNERLVNDLDLILTGAGVPILGGQGSTPDRQNTVETITVHGLSPGHYVLSVFGFNVPEGPQPFALAVSITSN